jgi:hypothetical protein
MKEKDAQKQRKIEMPPGQDSGVKETNNSGSLTRSPEEKWEKMYKALYDYYFGRIDFLSLLDKWEDILGIKPHLPAEEKE